MSVMLTATCLLIVLVMVNRWVKYKKIKKRWDNFKCGYLALGVHSMYYYETNVRVMPHKYSIQKQVGLHQLGVF